MGWKRRFSELESNVKYSSTTTGSNGLTTNYHTDEHLVRIHFTGSSVPFVLNSNASAKTEFTKVLYLGTAACSASFQIVNASNGRAVLGGASPLSQSNGSITTTTINEATLMTDTGLLTASGQTIFMLSGTVNSASPNFNPLVVSVFWRNSAS